MRRRRSLYAFDSLESRFALSDAGIDPPPADVAPAPPDDGTGDIAVDVDPTDPPPPDAPPPPPDDPVDPKPTGPEPPDGNGDPPTCPLPPVPIGPAGPA